MESKKGKDYNGSHDLLNSKYFSISKFYTFSGAVHILEDLLGMALVFKVPKKNWYCVVLRA